MPSYNYASINRVADPAVYSSIIDIGRQRGLSDDHILAALATGVVESNLRNPSGGTLDSAGWRQERAKYYGSLGERMNVANSVNRFYNELTRMPRQGRTLGRWAQAVQRSAYPDRYDQALGAARQFFEAHTGTRRGIQPVGTRPGVAQALRSTAKAGSPAGIRAALQVDVPFDARNRLTEFLTAMSNMQRERAGEQGPAPIERSPLETTQAEGLSTALSGPAEEGQTVEAAIQGSEGSLQQPSNFERAAEEVADLDLEDLDDDDLGVAVGNILAAGMRNAAEAEEARAAAAQAEAEAAAGAAQRQAAAPAPAGGDAWARYRVGPGTATGPGSFRGLKPNALRAAETARQLGFNGTIHGVGSRSRKSDHPHGNAIDLMVGNNSSVGDRLAQFYIDNRDAYGVKYVIWQQRIASASTGWKWVFMSDRGNMTANHYDHPHISFRA